MNGVLKDSIDSFFARMMKISKENKTELKAPVHKLIKEFKKLEWA